MMKKNAILFGIFILLMCATYFFQEKRVADEYTAKEFADRLIKEEVTHLKLPHAEAEKKKDVGTKVKNSFLIMPSRSSRKN